MKTFKEMKKGAKQTLKKHYLLAVFLVLIITFLGATKPVSRIMTESLIEPFKPNNSQSFSLLLQQTNGSPSTAVLDDMVAGNFEAGQEIADAYKEARMTGVAENGFGGNRGIASEVLATFGSGAVMLNLAKAVSGLLGSNSTGAAVVLIGSVLVSLLVFIFIQNILEPLVARMLMEARTYKNVPLTHIFHPFAVGRWFRMAMVMLVKSIFLGLWSLTIIGGIIKFFSYAMVPYITAENPNVKPLEAITLSRRMMKGHKWKLFLFYLSYIGWFLLGILTFGLLNYFFVDPYIRLGGVEFYEEVRRQAIENKIQGYELLNDEYLHEIPKHRVLNDNYLDTAYEAKDLEGRDLKLKGVQGFLAKAFGIWIGSTQKQREYQDYIIEKKGLEEDTDAMKIGRAHV